MIPRRVYGEYDESSNDDSGKATKEKNRPNEKEFKNAIKHKDRFRYDPSKDYSFIDEDEKEF